MNYGDRLAYLAIKFPRIHSTFKVIPNTKKEMSIITGDCTNVTVNLDPEELGKMPEDVSDFILAHELSHLDQDLEVPRNKLYDILFDYDTSIHMIFHLKGKKYTSPNINIPMVHGTVTGGLWIGILATGMNVSPYFSIPLYICTFGYSLFQMRYVYNRRRVEYDADQRAVQALGTNKGGIKYFQQYAPDSSWGFLTHPSNASRLRNISQ